MTPVTPSVIRGRMLDTEYEIVIDDAEIAGHVSSLYRDTTGPPRGGRWSGGPAVRGSVLRRYAVRTSERGYSVQVDGREVAEPKQPAAAVALLSWYVHRGATSLGARAALLHAGAVERDGRVVLLVGSSGVGKTTATLALVRRGFGYVSDDVVEITGGAGVRGAAKPVGMRLPTPELLGLSAADLGQVPDRLIGEGGQRQVAVSMLGGVVSEGGRAALVVVLTGVAGHVDRDPSGLLVPLRRSDALARLVEASPDLPERGASGFSVLAELVRTTQCFAAIRGDLDALGAEVEASLSQS